MLSPVLTLSIRENGLMGSPMESDKYSLMMGPISTALLHTVLFKGKEGSSQALEHIMKARYGIMLQKEREFIVMTLKSTLMKENG